MSLSKTDAFSLGRIVAGHGRHYVVEADDGTRITCHPRGKKSDAVVGDRVRWQATGDEGVIERIEPRTNLLYRQDEWKTKSFAANVDQMVALIAAEPVFSESQLARALIAAESAGIPSRIVLNKRDLPAFMQARARLQPYIDMGIEVHEVALKREPDASRITLRPVLDGRASFVLGPSGTGKSTLINMLAPDANVLTAEISQAMNTGRHTTTSTRWYWLDGARKTALIDSPGFQEFGLRQIDPQQLPSLMPDIRDHADCRFYNCTHLREPGCGVRAAVDAGQISASRYRIYGEIRDELVERH